MSRSWRLFLADMITSADRIVEDTAGISREQFDASPTVRDAVWMRLLILGEAAKRIPDDLKTRYPEVEWKKIAGFRDVIAHSYYRIDHSVVWDTARNRVPVMRETLARIAAELPAVDPETID